ALGAENHIIDRFLMPFERELPLSALHGVDANRRICTATGNAFAIGTEGCTVNKGVMASNLAMVLVQADTPDLHGGVVPATSQVTSMRMVGQAVHRIGVSLEAAHFLASGRVPDPHRMVPGRGGKGLAIGAERDLQDRQGMALQFADFRSCLHVP